MDVHGLPLSNRLVPMQFPPKPTTVSHNIFMLRTDEVLTLTLAPVSSGGGGGENVNLHIHHGMVIIRACHTNKKVVIHSS